LVNGSTAVREHVTLHLADLRTYVDRQHCELKDYVDAALGKYGTTDQLRALYALVGRSHRNLLGDHESIEVLTDKPVAFDSPDHLVPWGTMRDNSANLWFNVKLGQWIPLPSLRVLDLGCSGGGFVKSVIDMGCLAVGIEGSDYSKLRRRAEWATIPHHLFTADITAPFSVVAGSQGREPEPMKFSVITAWEVIEHIRRDQLPAVFRNVDAHLEKNGVMIMSVSPNPDFIKHVALHQTVEGQDWWLAECERNGFVHHEAVVEYFGNDWVRGGADADGSFHVALTRRGEPLYAELPVSGSPASRETGS